MELSLFPSVFLYALPINHSSFEILLQSKYHWAGVSDGDSSLIWG